MPTQRRTAVSYSRFSHLKQSDGDSAARQERDYKSFCERHNLSAGKEVFADRGRSGFHDDHRTKGELGKLIAAAKDGRFDAGTVIVIEAWDRLGRLRPDRQTELVAELLRTGVSIGICRLNDIFSEEDFGTHKWTALAVFIQLAYQESKQKSERLSAVWEQRRRRAKDKGELVGGNLPAWIELVDDEPRLIPARAKVVGRIFQLAADGLGVTRIVATLEREKVPAFGESVVHEGRTRSQFCGRWTRPYITRLLNDRRALGEMALLKGEQVETVVPDYFPAVVTEEQFTLARAAQVTRRLPKKERQSRHVNLFQGLLINVRDGGGFRMHNNGTQAEPELCLRSAASLNGHAATSITLPYHDFEDSFLERLKEIDPKTILPAEEAEASTADALRTRLKLVRADLANMQDDLNKHGFSKTLMAAVRVKEDEETAIANELQDELARNVKPLARQWDELPTLIKAIRTASDPDAARIKLRAALRAIVESVHVLVVKRGAHRLVTLRCQFVRGRGHRDYLIVMKQRYHQQEPTPPKVYSFTQRAASVANIDKPDELVSLGLDLRNKADAARAERALLKLDLEAGPGSILKDRSTPADVAVWLGGLEWNCG